MRAFLLTLSLVQRFGYAASLCGFVFSFDSRLANVLVRLFQA